MSTGLTTQTLNICCITKWFDRDDPTGNGDYELLANLLNEYPGEICQNPITIEAQTISGQSASQTGNVFQVYNPKRGFACEWCSKCRTPWFDRDNPSGQGDYETLSLALITYPLQVCAQPIAIEVATISGTPVLPAGNNFQIYDPTQGFACMNALQNGGCQDYKVRFTCPMSLCQPTCVTRWFDSDNPNTNGGDSERLTVLLRMYPGEICPNPIGIEAQTISGQPASQTGNVFQEYNPTTGISCINANQGGVVCADYKVHFTCPEEWCSTCRTSWLDRDDPDNPGVREIWTEFQTSYVCPSRVSYLPIAIEVTTVSGSPALLTGNLFQVFDPLLGFECVNNQQGGGVCQDYKVIAVYRFASFCLTLKCCLTWRDLLTIMILLTPTSAFFQDANKLLLNERSNWVHLKEFARKNAANALSVANMLMGMASILCSLNGHHHVACWLVLIGYLLDLADGAVARQLNACSALGAKLDDFADFTTFGIATSLILRTTSLLDNILCMLYVLSVYTRLCFFSSGIPFMYRGLPCIYSSAILVCVSLLTGGNMAVLRILAVAMILFMVSQNFYPHDRVLESQAWKKVVYIGGIAMVFCSSFPPACVYYLLWSISYILFPTTLWSSKV
ncbi:hypothetical protein G5714_022606 [Onychostoma macrolepis]|uniref:WxxW domain-containing protein n=3 Tax=Onychostoma macrolepis TaxID=369639 RepID=A0A7J6BNM6_9TELE|nr:hypothetical protein G5714_022606 [Onychostoma macrolepis]